MGNEKPVRRLTLRELLNQAEKCTVNLIENCKDPIPEGSDEFRGLSRPVRRRSQFPTMMAMQNSLRKLQEANDESSITWPTFCMNISKRSAITPTANESIGCK